MAGPSVGFVVPAYNAVPYLAEALRSVMDQGCGRWSAVVVDDGSSDGTAELAAEMAATCPEVRVVRQANTGVSAARNRGLAELAGSGLRWVCFLDSDDALVPGALADLAARVDEVPGAVGAYGVAEYMDSEGRPLAPGAHSAIQRRRVTFAPSPHGAGGALRRFAGRLAGRQLRPEEPTGFDALAVYGSIWPPAVALVGLEEALAVGGFDASLAYMEDWDFFLRLSRSGPLAFVDRQVAWYRRHPGNAGADLAARGLALGERGSSYDRTVAQVRYKAWSDPANTPEQRCALRKAHVRQQAGEVRTHVRLAGRQAVRTAWGEAGTELCRAGDALVALAALRPRAPRPLPKPGQ